MSGFTSAVIESSRVPSGGRHPFGYVIPYFRRGTRRPRTLPLQQIVGDRLLDPRSLDGESEVLAQHRGRQDRRRRVGFLLAREVRRAAVHRLERAGRGPGGIDAGAGGQPDAARHRGAE
jgi:hypothetical protein